MMSTSSLIPHPSSLKDKRIVVTRAVVQVRPLVDIIESVGEHGTMKALFNAPIKQHDTVCLPLYKRIFPKFPADKSSDETSSRNPGGSKPALVVY